MSKDVLMCHISRAWIFLYKKSKKLFHRFGAREVHNTFCKLKVHGIHASSFIHKKFCNRIENIVSVKQYLELKVPENNLSLERETNWTSSWTAMQVLNKCSSVQVV